MKLSLAVFALAATPFASARPIRIQEEMAASALNSGEILNVTDAIGYPGISLEDNPPKRSLTKSQADIIEDKISSKLNHTLGSRQASENATIAKTRSNLNHHLGSLQAFGNGSPPPYFHYGDPTIENIHSNLNHLLGSLQAIAHWYYPPSFHTAITDSRGHPIITRFAHALETKNTTTNNFSTPDLLDFPTPGPEKHANQRRRLYRVPHAPPSDVFNPPHDPYIMPYLHVRTRYHRDGHRHIEYRPVWNQDDARRYLRLSLMSLVDDFDNVTQLASYKAAPFHGPFEHKPPQGHEKRAVVETGGAVKRPTPFHHQKWGVCYDLRVDTLYGQGTLQALRVEAERMGKIEEQTLEYGGFCVF
ncbi:MAG: hypothetical protein M1822_003235 [Bathelium mastoideum]|nr:MAG: hypothetical protein M1822_003235 [Bathelium mastoideum]